MSDYKTKNNSKELSKDLTINPVAGRVTKFVGATKTGYDYSLTSALV